MTAEEIEALWREHWWEVMALVARHDLGELEATEVLETAGLVLAQRPTRPSERRDLLLLAVEAACEDLCNRKRPEEREGDGAIH